MNLFQELKRRKVFKTVGVYAAASLIIIQVADIVFPRLLLPDWTVTFVIVLVIIGFPITFFLSWTYDLKHDDTDNNQPEYNNEITSKKWSLTKKIIFPLTGLILTIIGGVFWFIYPFLTIGMGNEKEYDASIAILYMENISPDEKSYFADGLTEELITRLSRIQNLKVRPRTDVAIFKNKTATMEEISEKLSVNYIVEGAVKIIGDNLRVNVTLFDIAKNNSLWSESYNNTLHNILNVQDEIASSIVKKLDEKLTITKVDIRATERKSTENLEAYNLYSKATLSLSETNIDGTLLAKQTIPLLKKAIELDSTYADAYALLGLLQFFSTTNQFFGEDRSIPIMESAILNAETSLLYDPDNELGNASMVFLPMMLITKYDYYKENKIFKARNLAIKADKLIKKFPDSPLSHLILGYFYWNRNNIIKDENNTLLALDHMLKVVEITKNQTLTKDPLHKPILDQALQDVPGIYETMGQAENAIKFINNNKKYYCGDGTFDCLGVWTLNQISSAYYQSYYYKKAFEVISIILARTDEELINTGHGIQSKTNALFFSGMIHMKWDNYKKAIYYFKKNLDIYEKEGGDACSSKGSNYSKIGFNYFYMKDFANASSNFNNAYNLLSQCLQDNDEEDQFPAIFNYIWYGLSELLNGNIDNSKTPTNTGELWVQSFPLKPDTNSNFDAYLLYWPLYLYYKHLNQVDQANKYLTLAYEIVGQKQIDKYHNHSEKDTYPEFFYCRDIIKTHESSLNQ